MTTQEIVLLLLAVFVSINSELRMTRMLNRIREMEVEIGARNAVAVTE